MRAYDLAMEPEVLGHLERMYLTIILNDCLDQLSILSHVQLPPEDSDFSPDEGLDTMDERDIEELENEREENASLHKWQKATNLARPAVLLNALIAMIWDKMMLFGNLSKLGREHKLLELLMIATREEIANKGTFPCLATLISEGKLRKAQFEYIRDHTIETGKKVINLSRECAHLARQRRKDMESHNEIAGLLKISRKALNLKAYFKLAREKKFCNAHEEQKLKKMVILYDDIVEEFYHTEDIRVRESEVTKTISTYLNKRHAKLEEMLEYWMDQYERQLDEKQNKLEDVRNKRFLQWDRTFHLLRLYTDYSNTVEEYTREKLELELRESRQKRQVKSAVKIQSWWRSVMVQKHIGPYKLKKHGKEDKKKKKK